MINFPCLCGNKFSLADDMAGEMFQCAQCGLLVTVPSLDDLAYLSTDGTYNLDEVKQPKDRRVEQPHRREDSVLEGPSVAGIPLEGEVTERVAPRYNPFTGELIRAHVVEEHVQSVAAKAAPRVQPISKSNMRGVIEAPPPHSWFFLLGEMVMSRNAAVLVLMSVINVVLAWGIAFTVGIKAGFFFFVPLAGLLCSAGFYSIIVQETGPGQAHELPRPVRDFEFRTDMLEPLVHLLISVALCYGPAAILWAKIGDEKTAANAALAAGIIGTILFPALFLTICVDAMLVNLRPDRLLSVIFAAKLSYLPVVLGWTVGMAMTLDGMAYSYNAFVKLFDGMVDYHPLPTWYVTDSWIALGFIAVGCYLSYYACWQLGMVWRMHHARFNWVAQFHEKAPEAVPPGTAGPKSNASKRRGAKPV